MQFKKRKVLIPFSVKKAKPKMNWYHDSALKKLRDFLDATEPQVVRLLYGTWNSQQRDISYQELRDAIIDGTLSIEYLNRWTQQYAELINQKLAPIWLDAMETATEELHKKFPEFMFDPAWTGVQYWIQDHGTKLAVNLGQTQVEALKQLINRAAVMGEFGPDELSRVIRPLIGMVPRESVAVFKYYEALRKDGVPIKDARLKAVKYAESVHRHRAFRIARTELATAYNQGQDFGIRQAQARGYMTGEVKKKWLTADDERTCPTCLDLEGVEARQDECFKDGHYLPPAHPHCRCTVIYIQ